MFGIVLLTFTSSARPEEPQTLGWKGLALQSSYTGLVSMKL